MNSEAFRYFHVFPLTVRPRARTEDGNNLLHSELLFKIGSFCHTSLPEHFQKMNALVCVTLLNPLKERNLLHRYEIAQFLSNMELYLSAGECNGLHKHRRNWHGRRESHPHKAVLETAALLMYHVRKKIKAAVT